MIAFLLLLLFQVPAITVDAGPPKTIALPAHDVTLFGHAVSSTDAPLAYLWTQTSGPAGAVFSEAFSLVTSVSFTNPGVYNLQLSAADGTALVNQAVVVTVLATQASFYVDPNYTGKSDGSASAPWPAIVDSPASPQWAAINQALSKDNVIVYFPARLASGDVPAGTNKPIDIWRTDKSANRLTLDGMSMYALSDSKPSWAAYTGVNKFKIVSSSPSLSIGVQPQNAAYPMNSVTIRGFDVSGASGRILIAGNGTTLEYTHVHNITTVGANIMILPPISNYPACALTFGNLHDITFRNNAVDHGFGEGIYFGGTYDTLAQGGCLAWAGGHSDILAEGNTIDQTASQGGQADGFDLKSGVTNVTIRGNEVIGGTAGTRGVVALGVYPAPDGTPITRTNYVIENNRIHDRPLGSYSIDLSNQFYSAILNNVIYNASGINLSGVAAPAPWPYTYSSHVTITGNTLNVPSTAISVFNAQFVTIRNTLVTGNSGLLQFIKTQSAPGSNIDSDYNVLIQARAPFSSGWVEGTHTIFLGNGAVTRLP